MIRVWVIKCLRDLRSGKPETDVTLFNAEAMSEAEVRAFIGKRWPEALPWDCEEDEDPTVWSIGNPRHPDEFIELGEYVVDGSSE